HLELLDLAAALTAADRALLRRAGGAVRRDPLGQPYLLPKDAEQAIAARPAGALGEPARAARRRVQVRGGPAQSHSPLHREPVCGPHGFRGFGRLTKA